MKSNLFIYSILSFKIKYVTQVRFNSNIIKLNKPELFKDWSTYKSLLYIFNFFDSMKFTFSFWSFSKQKKIKQKKLIELPSTEEIFLETQKDFYWLSLSVNPDISFNETNIKDLLNIDKLPTLIKRNPKYTENVYIFFLIKSEIELKYTHEINGIYINTTRSYRLNRSNNDLIINVSDLSWIEINWNIIKMEINSKLQDYVYYRHDYYKSINFFKFIDYKHEKITKKDFILLSKKLPVNYNCTTILFKSSNFFEKWKQLFLLCDRLNFNLNYVSIEIDKTPWKSIKTISLKNLLELSIDKDDSTSIVLEATLGFFWLKLTFKDTSQINLDAIKNLLKVYELPTVIKPIPYTKYNSCFLLIKSNMEIDYLNIDVNSDIKSCRTYRYFELSTESTLISSNLDLYWLELNSDLPIKNNIIDYIWQDNLFGFKDVYYKYIKGKNTKITKKEYISLYKSLPARYG